MMPGDPRLCASGTSAVQLFRMPYFCHKAGRRLECRNRPSSLWNVLFEGMGRGVLSR